MVSRNQIVLIIGSASGIGRETAKIFAKNKYTVLCTDLDRKNLDNTVSAITKNGGNARAIYADITRVEEIKYLAKEVEERYKRLDILINCAGVVGSLNNLIDSREKDMDLIIDVNLKGTYRCCKYLLPIMIRKKRGTIINIGSQAGKTGIAGVSIYVAAKWGVIGLTKSLDLELRKYGIKVVLINPGSTNTRIYDKFDFKFKRDFLKKFLNPADIARACIYVAEQPENCLIKELDVIPMCETMELKMSG
jgi:NADP-dependent 3-hydroxy acid dehydrogenase YdfG